MSTSGLTASRLGFRGAEDLGGALAASFWLEAGLANDTGIAGSAGTLFNRRSTVSVSGVLGEIRLGRDDVPTYWNDLVFDPFGNGGVGNTLFGSVGASLAIARGASSASNPGGSYARTSNSIGYFLPANLGGFYGQVIYGLHENSKVSGVARKAHQPPVGTMAAASGTPRGRWTWRLHTHLARPSTDLSAKFG